MSHRRQHEQDLLRRVERLFERQCELLEEILRYVKPHNHYTVRIGGNMAITAGSNGTFAAALLDNGAPVTGFTPSFSWTADDTNAALQPSADTLSCEVTVPATDTTTTLNLTASTQAPDGTTATGSLAVTINPSVTPQKFTVSITQTA